MPLPPFTFTIFDTETTGLEPGYDHIFELAVVRCEEGEKCAEYDSLYAVAKELPLFVQMLTRVYPSDLAGKPAFSDERKSFVHLFEGAVLIGHNILFDIGMMKGEGLDVLALPWVDSAMLASIVFPELASYSLPFVSGVLDLPHEPQHRALGDVHATLALVEKVWERVQQLPQEDLQRLKDIARRSTPGYRTFFAAAASTAIVRPSWLHTQPPRDGSEVHEELPSLHKALQESIPPGAVHCVNVTLSPSVLPVTIAAAKEAKERTWIGVKNLEATIRGLSEKPLEDVTIIRPAVALCDAEAAEAFLVQKSFTSDECTLACKLALYAPVHQSDLPIHGGEHDVWKGKIACSDRSPGYLQQFQDVAGTVIIDQRHLLECIRGGRGPVAGDRIVLDDASMLEDTATKAYQSTCVLDVLRAAAEGREGLTRFLDALQIWLAQTRGDVDTRYLTESDLGQEDVRGLRSRLENVRNEELSQPVQEQLAALAYILDQRNLEGRIVWMERFRDGGETLHSAPLDSAQLLWEDLYDAFPVTLLLPPGGREQFPAIIPPQIDVIATDATEERSAAPSIRYASPQMTLDRLLPCVDEKIIVLMSSKRSIMEVFTKHVAALEEKGIALIAQGTSGGQGRMQAEFLQAPAPAVWLLTPWTYEGIDLPEKSVDRLILHTVPFDHPRHTVLSRRADRVQDPFTHYMFPRMLHRLFRLLRTFTKHRTESGDVLIMDARLHEKAYGKAVKEYLAAMC